MCLFLKAEDGVGDVGVTGVQTCALPISISRARQMAASGRADAVYVDFLAEFLVRLAPLEAMMVYFESRSASAPPMDSFARVADFLQTALLPFVMRDLVHMLDLFIGRVGELLESGRA